MQQGRKNEVKRISKKSEAMTFPHDCRKIFNPIKSTKVRKCHQLKLSIFFKQSNQNPQKATHIDTYLISYLIQTVSGYKSNILEVFMLQSTSSSNSSARIHAKHFLKYNASVTVMEITAYIFCNFTT